MRCQFRVFRVIHRTVDDHGNFLLEGLLQCWNQILGFLDPVSNGAHALCKFHKIRVGEVHIAVLMVLIHLFPLDQSIAGIVEDQGDKRSFSSQGSLELLTVHHEAAVTADGQDLLIRVDQSGTDSSWDGDAHGGEAIGDDAGIWFIALIVAGNPHFVRAHI